MENHYPGKEVGQAFQPDLQCLSFVPGSWRHQRGRLLGLFGWHDIGGHPRFPGTTEWVAPSAWPLPLPPPIGCNLSTNRKRKPKWRRCVASSIAVGPSTILTGSRTRPSDWGLNARFGPVEDPRNNRRFATFTCILCSTNVQNLRGVRRFPNA